MSAACNESTTLGEGALPVTCVRDGPHDEHVAPLGAAIRWPNVTLPRGVTPEEREALGRKLCELSYGRWTELQREEWEDKAMVIVGLMEFYEAMRAGAAKGGAGR